MQRIGLDVGGSKIDAGMLSDEGEFVLTGQVATPGSYKETLQTLASMIRDSNSEGSIGLGLPGLLTRTGYIEKSNNLPFLEGYPLGQELSRMTGRTVYTANHLRCFALSESRGSLSGERITLCVVLGTGIGLTILLGDRIYVGENQFAGEVGSAPLIAAESQRSIEEYVKIIERPAVSSAAGAVDTEIFRCLVRLFANLCYFYDPSRIIVQGGLVSNSNILDRISKELPKILLRPALNTQIQHSRFGELSGVRGAALLSERSPNQVSLLNAGVIVVHHPVELS